MAANLSRVCDQHEDPFDCSDNLVYWSAPLDEYALIIHDGSSSYMTIEFCPWCGRKLESKRDRWMAELEALGFDTPLIQDIPPKYQSDEWYREKNAN